MQDTITIYDVTNKVGNTTNIISITTFPGAEYIHQGKSDFPSILLIV